MTNKRIEELIIRYAYGELEDHEIPFAEGLISSSAEARRLFELYSLAKAGTKALAQPPSPQLSAERLREAILSREIKTVNSARWNWLGIAAPTAVAAALAFYVFLPDGTARPALPDRVVAEQDQRSVAPPELMDKGTTTATPSEARVSAAQSADVAKTMKQPAKRAVKVQSNTKMPSPAAPASAGEPAVFETVVVINAGPSSADGTRDATELGYTTDVSFGN